MDEPNETVFVNLMSPSGATIADGQGIATITDNDAAPTIAVGDITVVEGTGGNTTASFSVTLSAPSGFTVTVNFTTANGSATAPSDYTATSGTVTFAPGTTTANGNVPVVGDSVNESTETFVVNLSSPTNATIADAQGVATITDNDAVDAGHQQRRR